MFENLTFFAYLDEQAKRVISSYFAYVTEQMLGSISTILERGLGVKWCFILGVQKVQKDILNLNY